MSDLSINTKETPFNNGAHISKVEISKAIEPVGSNRSPVSHDMKLVFFTNRTTLSCRIITPLGLPVEPEV